MESPEEAKASIVKVIVFGIGVTIGLASKLATINRERTLTMKEVIFQTSIAFAVAFLVWYLLQYYHKPELANICAVLCGRFADSILLIIWKAFKKWFSSVNDEINKN